MKLTLRLWQQRIVLEDEYENDDENDFGDQGCETNANSVVRGFCFAAVRSKFDW